MLGDLVVLVVLAVLVWCLGCFWLWFCFCGGCCWLLLSLLSSPWLLGSSIAIVVVVVGWLVWSVRAAVPLLAGAACRCVFVVSVVVIALGY